MPFHERKYSDESSSGQAGENRKDQGVSNWITVFSPDDLFNHNVDVNFEKLCFRLLPFNA